MDSFEVAYLGRFSDFGNNSQAGTLPSFVLFIIGFMVDHTEILSREEWLLPSMKQNLVSHLHDSEQGQSFLEDLLELIEGSNLLLEQSLRERSS